MHCPVCNSRTRVVHTQHVDPGTHRWRHCLNCDNRFRSFQEPETLYTPDALGVGPNAVFTPEDVRNIRRLAASGTTKAELSKAFGVHTTTIASIIKHRNYASV